MENVELDTVQLATLKVAVARQFEAIDGCMADDDTVDEVVLLVQQRSSKAQIEVSAVPPPCASMHVLLPRSPLPNAERARGVPGRARRGFC
jgi:hypothetical protein